MDNDIYKSDYFYDLPQDLIAKYPLKERTMSKLLCLDKSDYRIVNFPDIVKKIDRNDLLVINETKVFQARLELNKKTGGRVGKKSIIRQMVLLQQRQLEDVKMKKKNYLL